MTEERKHQVEMQELTGKVIAGRFPRKQIVLDCTPGGGKTASGTICANLLLDANVVDTVLWLVPRLSLAEQVIDAFGRGVGACPQRCLTVADPGDNLFPPTLPNMPRVVGHVTTYQAVASRKNWQRFRDVMVGKRTLLIFDEVQFLNDPSNEQSEGWHRKVRPVYEAAAFRLLMSGTLWRTDNHRIPFVEHERHEDDGLWYPVSDIVYTLRDAVAERAVLPTEWINRGGTVEYAYKGENHVSEMLSDGDDEETRKVRTFLAGDNAVAGLLDDMVDHWRDWTKRVYQSRMLVMAETIQQARKWQQHLQEKHKLACTLATSKEEAAGRKLLHFRERKHGQCLVTVAMAYVGFDCPDLTHLAYLSATRAPSWMLQSFARVSRHDHNAPVDYDHQHAHVFAPDDQRMREFCAWLRNQQSMGLRDRQIRTPLNGKAAGQVIIPDDGFEPIAAAIGAQSVESLLERIGPDTKARLDAFRLACPAAGDLPYSKLFSILTHAGVFA